MIVLLLLYVLGGEVRFEQHPYKDEKSCVAASMVRMSKILEHPRFERGLYAACVEAKIVGS